MYRWREKCVDFSVRSCEDICEYGLGDDMETNVDRKTYSKMLEWKREYTPEYALFLKGVRRTGKTTLAERMGKENYRSYIMISFDKASNQTKNLFVDYLEDLDTFFNILQINYHTELYPGASLIIPDEIQLYPYVRQALKTLLADGRYDYIETGSLAGIEKKHRKSLSHPKKMNWKFF